MNLLLAAGVQAVKVVNDSALHVRVINTPLPVHVTDGPDIWSEVGTVAAIAAAFIALVTLGAVIGQIVIARRQLKLAEDELKAVKDDLNTSKQMAELALEQAKLANRRPDLRVVWSNGMEIMKVNRGARGWSNFNLELHLWNRGSITSPHCSLECFLPSDSYDREPLTEDIRSTFDVGKTRYFGQWGYLFHGRVSKPIYTNEVTSTSVYVSFGLRENEVSRIKTGDQIHFQWQVRDDYNLYPGPSEKGDPRTGVLILQIDDPREQSPSTT